MGTHKGRNLGFSLEATRALLRLAEHPEQPCEEADRLASAHLAEVGRKIEELGRLPSTSHNHIRKARM